MFNKSLPLDSEFQKIWITDYKISNMRIV